MYKNSLLNPFNIMIFCLLLMTSIQSTNVIAQPSEKSDFVFNEEKPVVDYGKEIARVNGYPITLGELHARMMTLPPQMRQQYQSISGQKELLDQLIKEILLEQAAHKKGLDKDPLNSGAMTIAARDILIRVITQKEILNLQVTEEEAKRWYNEHLSDLVQPESVHAMHILLKTEKEAKKVLSQVKRKNANFAKIASDNSMDPNTRVVGGDLGYIYRGQTVSEFEKAAFNTPIGQISGIVKSPFGYHIIKIEDKRSAGPVPFDQVFEQIKDKIKFDLFLKPIMDQAKIEIMDDRPESGSGAVAPSK